MKAIRSMGLVIVLATVGCAGESEAPLTWEEFEAQAVREDGVFIFNGDETAETAAELQAAYGRYLDTWNLARGIGSANQGLIVNRVGGADDKWNSTTAVNLTYCIATTGASRFLANEYPIVQQGMNNAAAAWESTARVNFIHVPSQDSNCTSTNGSVVFNVRWSSSSSFLASAFFPSNSRPNRQLRISWTALETNISPYTMTGILTHELGHTIGFRHEHTRPEAGTCFEDNNWRALTTYDSSSVMHYPQCNGTQTGDLSLTSRDRSGAASLYPF